MDQAIIDAIAKQVKAAVMEELAPLPVARNNGGRYGWRVVQAHLYKKVRELHEERTRPYWQVAESIRELMRPTFGLKRVEYLPAEKVDQAIAIVDAVVAALKVAPGK